MLIVTSEFGTLPIEVAVSHYFPKIRAGITGNAWVQAFLSTKRAAL